MAQAPIDPKVEAERALNSLDQRIQRLRNAGRGPRRPRWLEVAVILSVLLLGTALIYLGWLIGPLLMPLLLVLSLMAFAPGLLMVLVGLRYLARTITSLLSSEAGSIPRGEDGGDDAGTGPSP